MFRTSILVGFIAAMSLSFANTAKADILLEPYVGYVLSGKLTAPNTPDASVTGPGYGARIGYQTMGFMVGGEYLGAAVEDNKTPKSKYTITDMGVFAGYNFPVLIRVYGTYFFSSEAKGSNVSGSNTLTGSGIKLGVGFTPLPLVSINLEMLTDTLTKGSPTAIVGDRKATVYILAVSVPLVL